MEKDENMVQQVIGCGIPGNLALMSMIGTTVAAVGTSDARCPRHSYCRPLETVPYLRVVD